MSRIPLIVSYVLAFAYASSSLCAVDYPVSPITVGERYPGNLTSAAVILPSVSSSNGAQSLTSHEIVSVPGKGVLSALVGTPLTYTPTYYMDGNDSFVWQAINSSTGLTEQYVARISITSVNNPPVISTIPGNALSFQENQSIVGTITVFDPDSSPATPSSLLSLDVNGTDAIKFDANYTSTSGNNHTFTIWYTPSAQPDFEAVSSSYSVTLEARNYDSGGAQAGGTVSQAISISLTNQPEAPIIVSTENPIARTIDEDEATSTLLGFFPMEIAASDPEGSNVTWSYSSNNPRLAGTVSLNGAVLAAGAQSSSFSSGTLVRVDYTPSADAFGSEILTFVASDASNSVSSSIPITMTVNAVNSDPISLNAPSPIVVNFIEEGTGPAYDFNATDPDSSADPVLRPDNNASASSGAKIYYTLSGTDADKFQVSSTGQLLFNSPPDYETPSSGLGGNVYTVNVEVRDSQSLPYNSDSQAVSVTVTALNELPTLKGAIYSHDISVTEDVTWTWNSVLVDLNATDVDAGHQSSLVWRIKSGADGGFGTASASGIGAVPTSLTYVPDLDYAGDGNPSNPDDTFIVEVFDGVGVTEIAFRVFITPVSDPPRLTAISPVPAEMISITRDRYTINLNENNPSTVRLEFAEPDGGTIGNFEILNESLDKVKFTDSPYWTPGATFADLNFSSLHIPDFEDNQSSDGDGNYSLVVRVSDNEGTPKYQNLYLDFIIQDVDEAPAFAQGVDFNQTALENQTHAAILTAIDPEGVSSFYWDIVFGYDSPKFQLSAATGSTVDLSFIVPPNFEAPLDGPYYGDKNNTYVVRVRVSDALSGGKSVTQTFCISVADANDFPSIVSTPLNIDEPLRTNAMMDLSQYASDEDNQSGTGADTLSWSELSGDTTSFALDQNGTLRFNQDSDYESDSNFSIEVRVSDGRGGYADANFTVEVNAQNEAPEFFENNASSNKISFVQFDLAEDTSISGKLSNYARDPETGTSTGLTFGETFIDYNASNPDANGTLLLNNLSGDFTFTPRPNYSGLTYIDFTVSDGLMAGTLPIVFAVSEVPDPPVVREGNNTSIITGLVTKAILESNTTYVMDLNATDLYDVPASTTFIWSFGGPDSTKFKIDPNPGPYVTLSLLQVPDFENPHDAGADNVFDINVSVTDGGNSVSSIPIQLNILNGSEDPYFDYGDGNRSVTTKSAASFAESATGIIFDANATDLDGSAITYGLTNPAPGFGNGPDNALFNINPTTGQITFKTPPDYEAPLDDDANNTYVLEVNATDDTSSPNKISHLLTFSVTNLVEPPTFIDGASRTITWNETGTLSADVNRTYTPDATKPPLEISGGADQALFSLNVATGLLSFINPPDFENPGSADGDNLYDVQIRISGTSVTQDLSIDVTEGNDAPVITSTNLTQITVNENVGFVIDLDVTDEDSGPELLDVLFTRDSNSTRFAAHSGGATVNSFYPAVSSGMVDNNLAGASFSTTGDLDGDGDVDVICLEKSLHNIHFMENNGSGTFSRKAVSAFANVTAGEPDHAVITDLDQDGDQDVVVAFFGTSEIGWFENNASGTGDFAHMVVLASRYPNVGGADYLATGDLDGDSYPDLIVAYRSMDVVAWFSNQGDANPTFAWKGNVADGNNSLDAPRTLELVDLDNSGTLDVLIAANQNIYLASNSGMDGIFTVSSLAGFTGAGLVVKARDFTSDGLIDIVYASYQGAPNVLIQNTTGFNSPVSLPSHSEPAKAVAYPSDLAVLPATASTRVSLVVSDSSTQYLSVFEAKATLDGQFEQPSVIDAGVGITSLSVADLNRQANALQYSFVGGEDQGDFNATRFKDGGRLFFNKPFPNFEAPHDASEINRYDVIVKVSDGLGGETVRSIAVTINEVNEPPVITSLDGNLTASHVHNEGNLTTLFDVLATNDESSTQTVTFSLAGGPDEGNFSIDASTGRLTFLSAPDFESPSDANLDNSYQVVVRVTDDGPGSPYDEQNVTVVVVDGFEPAKFDATFATSYVIDEDSSLPAFLLSATDQNTGGGIAGYGVRTNGANGTATVTGSTFNYVPDGNFTGTDVVVVEVNNTSGLSTSLSITIQMNSVNDLPVITTPLDINHTENLGTVANLSAADDSNATLVWSWADGTQADNDFLLTATGTLTFRQMPDYELPGISNNVFTRVIRVTDSDGNYTDGNFTITVVNQNDNAPVSPYLIQNASSTFTLMENLTTVVDLNVTDADNALVPGFNPISYAITGGPDSARFSVSNNGRVSILPAPDFENPSSADLDNIFRADLTVSDGGYSSVYPLVVTVTNADESPPVITSDGGGADANFSIRENTLTVTQVVATDVESTSFTYTIWGGSDQNLFEINATNGTLSFLSVPDYESPSDGDGNNLYEVWIRVSDALTFDEQRMNVTITDVDEIPIVSPSFLSTMEDVPVTVTFSVADPEGRITDSTLLTPPNHGTLSWSTFPLTTLSDQKFTYTPESNYSGTDSMVLRVTDGVLQGDVTVHIEVNATNDPPSAVKDVLVYDDPNFAPLLVDVLANDSNAPDQNGTEVLTISSWGQPIAGTLIPQANSMTVSYQPNAAFIGLDTFTYVLSDGSGLVSTGTVEIEVKRAAGLSEWRFLKNMGFYTLTAGNWIYHTELGWIYLSNPAQIDSATWMWTENLGWFWTGNQYAPNVYLNDLSGWFAFTVNANLTPKQYMAWPLYDQTLKKWMSANDTKIGRVNAILAKFTTVEEVVAFVEQSPLFTPYEKKNIKTELFFTGRSPTIDSMGFTLGK